MQCESFGNPGSFLQVGAATGSPCLRFAFIGNSPPDALTAHKIDQFYDLDSPRDVSLKPDEFCDRVIHSFAFVPAINEDNHIQGFHFTSDRLKAQCLWFVNLTDIIELMTKTGKDYPSHGIWIRAPDGSLNSWSGDGPPPPAWLQAAKRHTRR